MCVFSHWPVCWCLQFKTLAAYWQEKNRSVCRVMVSFQIWMSVSLIMFVIRIFLGVTEWCRTSSGKSGTSVRYQSFGCSASGHLENICTNRRSQMFLWIRWDEFLPQTLWHLLSLSLPPPTPPHCQHHFALLSLFLVLLVMCVWVKAKTRYNHENVVYLKQRLNTLNNYFTTSQILFDRTDCSRLQFRSRLNTRSVRA